MLSPLLLSSPYAGIVSFRPSQCLEPDEYRGGREGGRVREGRGGLCNYIITPYEWAN